MNFVFGKIYGRNGARSFCRLLCAAGSLPGACASLAFPYIPMQGNNPKQYDKREALQQGTLFPGLDLPFHRELKSRFPAVNSAQSELMALGIWRWMRLGLYLTTHADDKEALALYWE